MKMKLTLFFLALVHCLYAQTLQWAKSLNYSQPFGSNVEGIGIKTDLAGNTYVAGNFTGTADFDPSAGTVNLVSTSTYYPDIFIAKYNPSGGLVFAKSIGSANAETVTSLAVDANGNIAVCGYFVGAVDFDPGAAVQLLTSAGRNDAFFARYDAAGNYVFARSVGGSLNDSATSIALDASDNLYLTGLYNGPADFDPGAGVQNLSGTANVFFAKYDAAGNYVYAKQIGNEGTDQGNGITVDGAGNVYLTGFFGSSADFDPGAGVQMLYPVGFDAFFAKYDAAGNYVFAKQIGGAGADQGLGLAIDGSANIFITGYFNGTVDFDPGAGTQNLTASVTNNFFLAKYDAAGNYVYAQRGFGAGLAVDAGGNAFVTGSFSGTQDFDPGAGVQNLSSAGGTDAFFAKYNAAGGYVYAKAVGGAANDGGNAIALNAAGEIYLTGFFMNSADVDPGAGVQTITGSASAVKNGYVARYDAGGNYAWAGSMGGYLNTLYSSTSLAMAKDAAGNLYITGQFAGSVDFDPGPATLYLTAAPGTLNMFLAKYDPAGNVVFAKAMTASVSATGFSLVIDAGGNVCMTGRFLGTVDFDPGPATANLTSMNSNGDLFIAKYDAAGGYVYAKQFGNNNGANNSSRCITTDASGNVYITGEYNGSLDFDPGPGTQTLTSVGAYNIFFAKYDASGAYVYARSVSITFNAYAQGIASDGAGNVYLTGAFTGTGDFDPGPGTQNLTSAGYDVYLAKYDASGGYVFAKQIGGSMQEQANAIAVDAAGNSYITGYFSGTADFDPGPGVQNLTAGNYDGFVAKYDAAGNYLFARNFGGGSSVLEPNGLALDENGNVLVTGRFGITVDFNLGSTPVYRTSQDDDVFLSKYTAAGTLLAVATAGGAGMDISRAVVAGPAGTAYITGFFNNVADFDPTAGVQNLTSLNGNTIFLAGYQLPGSAGGALPLRLTSFTAQNNECNNTLIWASENETAFNRFELEQSTDNAVFRLSTTIPAKGASSAYRVTVPSVAKTVYYRLKMVDNDGRFQYSSTLNVTARCGTGFGFTLSPNPAAGNVDLRWYNAEPGARVAVSVLDAAGRTVLREIKTISAYSNSGLTVSGLQKGVYWINAVDVSNNATYRTGFVKQ